MGQPAGDLTPYHIVPGPQAAKRILLVSYHAPPSNAVGAIRWTAMARYFAERGWGFDILAADPAGLPSRNEALLGDLPPGTRLFGVPDTLPLLDRGVNTLVRARQRLRRRVAETTGSASGAAEPGAAPSRSLGRQALNTFHAWREHAITGQWAQLAAETGRRLFDPAQHRWVISSGPPHMSHEGGRLLARWTGLPFIADFRDAWRFQEWVPLGPSWRWFATRFESRVVRQSAITVANVEPVRALMQRAYPDARILTITNGVDEGPLPEPVEERRFVIGYPGTIYLGRNPAPMIQAAGEMARELGLGPSDLSVEFMGFFDPPVEEALRRAAATHGLEAILKVHPGRSRPEALRFMATCTMLVGLQAGSDLAIPAKVFEFMRFPAWQLVLAGKGSATAELLAGTGADVHEPSDVAGIRETLTRRYREFRERGRPAPLGNDPRFSRRFQAGLLLDAMESA